MNEEYFRSLDLKNIWSYRGYKITKQPNGPVTGLYRAERFGVSLGAGTKEALLYMIYLKENNA